MRLVDDSSGTPTSWNWDFDDGTGAAGPEVTKIWDREGIFTVTLFVADAQGALAQQTHQFTVIAEDVLRVPSAGFTLTGDTVEVGETIGFSNNSTGNPDSLFWEFGDGSTASGANVNHAYSEPGVYTVTLTASNEAGPNSVSAQITVIDSVEPPVASIAQFPGVVEAGQSITLRSTSSNSPTTTSWNFDDGTTGIGEQVRHSWDTPGTYRIRLSVSNSAGSSEAFADIVVETPITPPIARFSQSSLTAIEGEDILFSSTSTNNPTTLTWTFDDGTNATGANVSHSWPTAGTYLVTLTATNAAGSDSISKQVTIDPVPIDPPTAAFTASALTVPVNQLVSFTDTSTGTPTLWSWNFDDGGALGAVQNPTRAFAAPGTYTVTLTASNPGGSDSTSRTITVIDPPTASFTQVANELDVVFTDTSQNGPTSWAWNFGDGTTSTLQSPSHTYAAPGSYPVTLVTSNGAGDSIPFSTTVIVDQAPTANFTSITGGLTAQFTDASIDGPVAWSWDFDDGNSSSVQNPAHTYGASGTYNVTLTVSNSEGSDSITRPVTVVLAPPVANVTCTVVGAGVSCDGSGSTSAATYTWTSTGGVTPTVGQGTSSATFTYPTSGTFNITLTVADVEGTQDSAVEAVAVVVPQPPTITNIATSSNVNGVVDLAASATESPTSWSWTTSPDGTITAGATTATPTITYTTPGVKTVTAIASNAVGPSAPLSSTVNVTIAAPPPTITSIAAPNTAGVIPLSAVVANAATYSWTASGGTLSSATSPTPTLTVTQNGTYTVDLTIANVDGVTASSQATVVVSDILVPPVVSPVVVGAEGPAGTVTVSAPATNSPTAWTWSVPASNEVASTAAAPTFTFAANGTYAGTVTATNAAGTSTSVNFQIVISGFVVVPPPVASFSSLITPASTLGTFIFDGTSDAATASYAWTLDGNPGAGSTVSHLFPAPGTYSVTLVVTDAGGSDTITQLVVVP